MSTSIGDFATSTVVYGKFTTYRPSTGAPFTLAGTPALSVYKDNSTTQSTTGVTLTVDFDGVTGLHHFAIDTSADGTFYAAGSFFDIVITTGTVDSVSAVGTVVGSFTLAKGAAFARLGAPAGASVSADVAAVKAETATILSDTNDIQTRLPAALVSGRIDASVGAMAANVLTATAIAADAITDAKVAADVTIASVTGAVGSVTAGVSVAAGGIASTSFAAGAIDSAAIAADAIGSSELAASAGQDIADRVLARNIAGGSDGGRDVSSALRPLRNKVAIAAGTLTVYQEDDTTSAWTAAVTTAAGDPLSGVDPT